MNRIATYDQNSQSQSHENRLGLAMNLMRHKCFREYTRLAIIEEPNKNKANYSPKWLTNKRIDAAIYITQSNTKICKTGKETKAIKEDDIQMFITELIQNLRKQKKRY